MKDATRAIRDIRDRSVIVDALCGAIVTLALATSSPQLEVLAVEAQRLMQANVSDLSSLLETIRLAA